VNTTFSSTDSYTFVVELDGYDIRVTAEIEGNILGQGFSQPFEYQGTLDDDGTTEIQLNLPLYGEVTASIDATQSPWAVSATADPGESSGFDPSPSTGTFDFLDFDATFTVNFSGGSNAVGTTSASLDAVSPSVTRATRKVLVPPNGSGQLAIDAEGSLLLVQWFEGTSGDASNPVAGGSNRALTVDNVTGERSFWARLTNHLDETVATETLTIAPSGFAASADYILPGSSFLYYDWIGWLFTDFAPWFWSPEHGFFYTLATSDAQVWFFDPLQSSWLYTTRDIYPAIFRASDGVWLWYFVGGTPEARMFYNFTTETTENVNS
jgi:hypothetical protein